MTVRRVAALYDIHGNLPALDAVLEEMASEDVELVVVGGDVVPGPWPGEVMERLDALCLSVRFIAGNGEVDVLAARTGVSPERVPEPFRGVLSWTAARLDSVLAARMAEWSSTYRLQIAGLGDVLFCHATPRDDNEIFTRITPEDRLRAVLEGPGADVVVCGHTHMPFDRTVGSVRVVNAGSVGMPFGDTAACWALLGPSVETRRTAYDVTAAARALRASGYPPTPGLDLEHPPSESAMLEAFEAASLR